MSIPRVYTPPVDNVSMLASTGRITGTLHVTAIPGRAAPIGLTLPDDSMVALTIEQLDVLVERLGQARADAVRIAVAERAVARG